MLDVIKVLFSFVHIPLTLETVLQGTVEYIIFQLALWYHWLGDNNGIQPGKNGKKDFKLFI